MKANLRLKSTLLAVLPILLAACATPPPASVNYPAPTATSTPATSSPASSGAATTSTPASTPPAPPAVSPAADLGASERALTAAIGLYERGEFQSAVRALTPMTTDGSLDPSQLLRALKTLAFAQCSANQRAACRRTFEQALRADSTFDLAPTERGHPIWGPEFVRARRTVLGK